MKFAFAIKTRKHIPERKLPAMWDLELWPEFEVDCFHVCHGT